MKINAILKRLLKGSGILIFSLTAYLIIVSLLGYIPVNNDFRPCEEQNCIEVFLLSNGVHTDIVVPSRSELKDWKELNNDSIYKYVAFGWGDKGFYLETPTWADLKFTTAFKALFFLSSSAMHVTLYENIQQFDNYRSVSISKENYEKLCAFIESGFKKNSDNNIQPIDCKPYGLHDKFYEANGIYNLFYTCNTWTNNCLKSAGLPACLWTLFDGAILEKYENNNLSHE